MKKPAASEGLTTEQHAEFQRAAWKALEQLPAKGHTQIGYFVLGRLSNMLPEEITISRIENIMSSFSDPSLGERSRGDREILTVVETSLKKTLGAIKGGAIGRS